METLKEKYPLIRFPVADGYALYAVVSKRPLRLAHVPRGDAWTVSPAHIRGLRLADVEEMIRREKAMTQLFGRKK